MKTNLVKLSAVAVAMVGGVLSASATVDVGYQISNPANVNGNAYDGTSGYQDLDTVNVSFKVGITTTTYNGVFAGGIAITKESETTGGPTMPQNYLSVCTDFLGTLYLGKTYEYSAPASSFSTVLGQPGGGGIDPGWNNPAKAIQNASQIFYQYGDVGAGGINTAVGGTKLNVNQMAALQVAIWIALYDTTGSGTINTSGPFQLLSSGPTSSYSSIIGYVNSDLSGLNGGYFNTGYLLQPDLTLADPTQGNSDHQVPQELLMGSSNTGGGSGNGSVPEPTTVLAGALLLIPLGASAIRILRKSKNI
jgi:hypothetical protein